MYLRVLENLYGGEQTLFYVSKTLPDLLYFLREAKYKITAPSYNSSAPSYYTTVYHKPLLPTPIRHHFKYLCITVIL